MMVMQIIIISKAKLVRQQQVFSIPIIKQTQVEWIDSKKYKRGRQTAVDFRFSQTLFAI